MWIAGHEYKIRSDGDDDALVRIAGYVDRAMQRVRERTGTVDSLDVAVLTCLNLAREILALHERPRADVGEEKLKRLIERVESVVGGGLVRIAPDISSETAATPPSEVEARPRTLDLPAVEDLRERIAAGGSNDALDASQPAPRARAAAGGRERVG
ncbi:MAG: cell division protein ZapA [Deltaproteobacteria bacterium]|nr:cell division protein ZapA [Deltaproteobacteria bacterium]